MSDENAVVIQPDNAMNPIPQAMEMGVNEVHHQVQKIQQIMRSVMKDGEHFGVIPGTQKPTLYKAGAEKLSLTFKLRPTYNISRQDLGEGHREYEVSCTLLHTPTGQEVGEGVGCCTTKESKYRYRGAEAEDTGKAVPSKYWDLKKGNKISQAQDLIGGKEFIAKKTDSGWTIHKKTGEKGENPDIADMYNTVLKMAKKRAFVDAMITTTAASDCFTQDMEDFTPPAQQAPPSGGGTATPKTKPNPGFDENSLTALIQSMETAIDLKAWWDVNMKMINITATPEQLREIMDKKDVLKAEKSPA